MILVTGHKGFIGSHIYDAVEADGLDLKDGDDIRTFEFEKDYDVIFHCAAQASIPKSIENPVESLTHNVIGTLRILEHARKTGAKVVFSSSSSIYDLKSPYALQKQMCEDLLRYYWIRGVKSIALRYFNVFGEGQEIANGGYSLVLSVFLDQLKRGRPFTIVGDGKQRRDFVYVGDVVEANLKAARFLDKAKEFEIIDIGTGINYSINEVADMIDKDNPRVNLPPRDEPFENWANINKAQQLLAWEPKKDLPSWLASL